MSKQTSFNNKTTRVFLGTDYRKLIANREKMATLQSNVMAGLIAVRVLDINGRLVGETKRSVNDG